MTTQALNAISLRRAIVPVAPEAFLGAMDAALVTSLRSTRRGMVLAYRALDVAVYLDRPDLAWRAMTLLSTLETL